MNAVAPIADEPEAFERVPPEGIKWHPYSDLFPWMDDATFEELKADIAKNGVLEPVVFLDGQILDGRNRYMAARDLGIEYPRVEYRGDDPLGYVISLNLKRRHLSESQRAMSASKIENLPVGANQHTAIAAPSQDQIADTFNVSVDSIQRAKKVREIGVPALVAAVETGVVSVSAAAEVAKLPVEEVQALVDKGPVAVKQAAREVREHGVTPRPIIDLKGRDPLDFNRAMHFTGFLERYAVELSELDLADILPRLIDDERGEVRDLIERISAIHETIIEGL